MSTMPITETARARCVKPTLAEVFDPRANSLNLLRLVFAALVLVSHSYAIGGFAAEPRIGGVSLGAFSVDAFFVISGFLITRSWLLSASTGQYLWRRFLRIFPGYWVCLAVTAVLLVPLIVVAEGGSTGSPLVGGSLRHWVVSNSVVYVDASVDGVLETVPLRGVINGSLWTLAWEIGCYFAIAALGVLGLLRRRHLVAVLTAGCAAVNGAMSAGLGGPLTSFYPATAARFSLLFLCGALVWLYADRLGASAGWAALAAVAMGLSLTMDDYRLLGALPLAYLCIWLGAVLPFHGVGHSTDLSYGIYIYAFPLQQLLAAHEVAGSSAAAFMVASIVTASAFAWCSWHVIERRAMALKDWRWAHTAAAEAPAA